MHDIMNVIVSHLPSLYYITGVAGEELHRYICDLMIAVWAWLILSCTFIILIRYNGFLFLLILKLFACVYQQIAALSLSVVLVYVGCSSKISSQ